MATSSNDLPPSRGALEGVTVLDFSHVLSGPFAGMILADMGATVLKIEPPRRGDSFREGAPFVDGMSHQFAAVNRGKHGLVLDLKTAAGRQAVIDLAKKADVVLNNFRPGVMNRLGIGAEALREVNPRLIFASISGFGQSGPMSTKPAFDPVAQAMSGLMSLTGEPGSSPLRAGLSWGDLMPGTFAALSIIAALYDRERTGVGMEIDVPMFDSLFYMLTYFVPFYQGSGKLPERAGAFHQTLVPTGTYPTEDGYIALSPVTQSFFEAMCRAIGREELIADPRFVDSGARQENRKALIEEISAETRKRTTDAWSEIFDKADVPAAPVLDIADLLSADWVEERGVLASLGYGELSSPVNPFHMSGAVNAVRRPAPRLGEDTAEILGGWLGYSDEQILAAQGAPVAPDAAAAPKEDTSA